jgi:hypothetical protein
MSFSRPSPPKPVVETNEEVDDTTGREGLNLRGVSGTERFRKISVLVHRLHVGIRFGVNRDLGPGEFAVYCERRAGEDRGYEERNERQSNDQSERTFHRIPPENSRSFPFRASEEDPV